MSPGSPEPLSLGLVPLGSLAGGRGSAGAEPGPGERLVHGGRRAQPGGGYNKECSSSGSGPGSLPWVWSAGPKNEGGGPSRLNGGAGAGTGCSYSLPWTCAWACSQAPGPVGGTMGAVAVLTGLGRLG
jgi:hypothetical protein